MLNLAAHRKDKTVAFAVALVLLLQAFFTAWANSAAAADAPQLDAFGNVLCVTDSDSDGAGANSKIPNCCTIACGMSAAALRQYDGTFEVFAADRFGGHLAAYEEVGLKPRFPAHEPGSPRAPPLAMD